MVVGGNVVLTAADVPAVVEQTDLNAEFRHRADRHADIPGALDRRGQQDPAVAFEKGQREQQSGDELGADVSGQIKIAAPELSADGQRQPSGGLAGHAGRGQRLGVYADRALRKSAAAGENGGHAAESGNGDHKAQGAAAFAAVQRRCFVLEHAGAVHSEDVVLQFGCRAECLDAGNGRADIIAQRHRRDRANAARQRRADDRAVNIAFRRRRVDRAMGDKRGESHVGHSCYLLW